MHFVPNEPYSSTVALFTAHSNPPLAVLVRYALHPPHSLYRSPPTAHCPPPTAHQPDSHITLCANLTKDDPNAHVLDQYMNPSNPLAHYDGTAEEILSQTDENVDVIVMSAGTGGTVTGTARKIKERLPNCQIVAVDPRGSILAVGADDINEKGLGAGYEIEGIGYDFIPSVLNRNSVGGNKQIDTWVKIEDQESWDNARDMIRTEGLMCGGSSGSAIAGALKYIEAQDDKLAGKRVVVLLPDSIRNYMSKFLDDDWMDQNNFDYAGKQ